MPFQVVVAMKLLDSTMQKWFMGSYNIIKKSSLKAPLQEFPSPASMGNVEQHPASAGRYLEPSHHLTALSLLPKSGQPKGTPYYLRGWHVDLNFRAIISTPLRAVEE